MNTGEIIIYQTKDGQTSIDVKLENKTVWLTQSQIALLFDCSTDNDEAPTGADDGFEWVERVDFETGQTKRIRKRKSKT